MWPEAMLPWTTTMDTGREGRETSVVVGQVKEVDMSGLQKTDTQAVNPVYYQRISTKAAMWPEALLPWTTTMDTGKEGRETNE